MSFWDFLHEHKYFRYTTDRYVKENAVHEKGVYICDCGKLEPAIKNWSTTGKMFRNRRLPKNARE